MHPPPPPADSLRRSGRPRRPASFLAALTLLAALAAVCRPASAQQPAQPLIVEDVQCRGNLTTSCRFIRGYLYLHAGQVLDEEEIRDATLRLSWLQNFKSVDIHLEKGSERGRVVVVIEVVEARSITSAFSLGVATRLGSVTQTLSADIGDRNLFGRGKSLDLTVAEDTSVAGDPARERFASLEYFDPQLFDFPWLFFRAGVYGIDSDYLFDNGDHVQSEAYAADASLGVRFGRFSYVAFGYRYFPHASILNVGRLSDGSFQAQSFAPRTQLLASYGFNTQDDPFFPTRGGRLNVYVVRGGGEHETGGDYQHVWRLREDSFLTLEVLLEPVTVQRATYDNRSNLSLSYSHRLATDAFGGIVRGRWYVGPGWTLSGYDMQGRTLHEAGVRAGVIFETRSLGYMSFYVFGSGTVASGGH